MEKKKILMVMAEIGGGHKIPAMAVKDAIEYLYPDKYQIDVVDFAHEVGAHRSDKRLKKSWDFLLAHPWFARFIFKVFMTGPGKLARLYRPLFIRQLFKKAVPYIKEYNPDIIFSTHFFAGQAAAEAKTKLGLPIKSVNFITDPFTGYIWWVSKYADYMMVASEESKKVVLDLGIPEEKIVMKPFPVRRKFFELHKTKEELIKENNLDPNKKIILTTAGGQGISSIPRYVKEIYKRSLPFNILSVCGRNEKLKNELEEFKKKYDSDTNLVPLGFVNNMNELISISDFTIAKAGASTTFESLFMRSPIIFTDWATYNEKPNLDYVVKHKAGWYAKNIKEFFKIIDDIMNTDIVEEYKKNIDKLDLNPKGAEEIAEFLVHNM